MTWPDSIKGSVSAGDQSAVAADKPLFIATNAAEFPQQTPQWRTGGNWASGSDDTAAGYSGRRAYDRQPQNQTKATTSGTTFYLLFDLHTTSTDPSIGEAATIDAVAVLNHNLGTLLTGADTATVSVQISETLSFTINYTIASRAGINTDERIIFYNLGVPEGGSFETYTGVRYARLKIETTTSIIPPSIGQVILGRRRQVSARPDVPYDDQALASNTTDFVSESGTITRYTRYSGGRTFAPTWTPTGSDAYSLDDVTTIRQWFEDCSYGSKPFLYVDKPHSERETSQTGITRSGHYVLAEPALEMPAEGPVLRNASLSFTEIAPFQTGET